MWHSAYSSKKKSSNLTLRMYWRLQFLSQIESNKNVKWCDILYYCIKYLLVFSQYIKKELTIFLLHKKKYKNISCCSFSFHRKPIDFNWPQTISLQNILQTISNLQIKSFFSIIFKFVLNKQFITKHEIYIVLSEVNWIDHLIITKKKNVYMCKINELKIILWW